MAFLPTFRRDGPGLSCSNEEIPSSSLYRSSLSKPLRKVISTWWPPTALGVAVSLLYLPIVLRLARQVYGDANYSHALLVPFFCAFLVWRRRHDWKIAEKKPSNAGLILVIAAIALLYLASIGAELFISRASLVILLAGITLFVWGRASVRVVLFPLMFLLFAFPLPAILYNKLVLPLQLLSSRLAAAALEHITIVPVLREGNVLILPHCTLEVVEACSGIRSLLALVALAVGYSYLNERSKVVRGVLVGTMVPIAVIGNGVRVVCVALLANYLGAQTVESFLHPFSGVVIFLVSASMLLALHFSMSAVRDKVARKTK